MKNDELSDVYESVYGNGSERFFSETDGEEHKTIISMCLDWKGKRVLEIGCGEGDLSIAVSDLGAKSVLACDYSQNAIDIAESKIGGRDNVNFICDNWKNISGKYDVILMAGVLEHFDDPFGDLKYMMDNLVDRGGVSLHQALRS